MMLDRFQKKFIFCVNPGRSGSNYLCRVLSCADNICATHEPEHEYRKYSRLTPRLWDLKNRPLAESYLMRKQVKLGQINELLSRSFVDIYAETNPLFCTLWQDVILDTLSEHDVTVLILKRSLSEVLKSLLDLGWFTTRDGHYWMVTAYSVNSLIRPVIPSHEATPADFVISYLLNVEMYGQLITQRCVESGHRVIEVYSKELFGNQKNILDLLVKCGLRPNTEKLSKLSDEKYNKAGMRKKLFDTPLDSCMNNLQEYIDKCGANAIELPALPCI